MGSALPGFDLIFLHLVIILFSHWPGLRGLAGQRVGRRLLQVERREAEPEVDLRLAAGRQPRALRLKVESQATGSRFLSS